MFGPYGSTPSYLGPSYAIIPIFQWLPIFPIQPQMIVYQDHLVQLVTSVPTTPIIPSMVVAESAQVGPSTLNPQF